MSAIHAILRKLIFACVTGIWLVSNRRQSALIDILKMCRAESKPGAPWRLCTFNVVDGLHIDGVPQSELASMMGGACDPEDATSVVQFLPSLATLDKDGNPLGSTILVLENCEDLMDRPNFRQVLEKTLYAGKQKRVFVLFLSGIVNIPVQMKSMLRVVNHPMPTRQVIENIIRRTLTPEDALPADEASFRAVVGATGGMNEWQVQEALNEALVDLRRGEKINPLHLSRSKKEALAAIGLTLYEGGTTLSSVVGLDNAKNIFRCLLRPNLPANAERLGVVLVGVPGTGKDFITRAVADEFGFQMVKWNPNSVKGSLQGESEAKYQTVKQTIEALGSEGGRVILAISEMEKLFQGFNTSGARTDGGVMAGIGGDFMDWLADRPKGQEVFVVGTCNDLSSINAQSAGATTRAGRFNTTIFFDFPSPEQKLAAWKMYRAHYSIPVSVSPVTDDSLMTPAEIKAVCAAFVLYNCKSLDEAKGYVPLVSVTSAEEIAKMRWAASGRYVSAEYPGLFTMAEAPSEAVAADLAAHLPSAARPQYIQRPKDSTEAPAARVQRRKKTPPAAPAADGLFGS